MELVVVGLNHRTAPLEFRERFHFSPEDITAYLPVLTREKLFREAELISTCNRTELHVAVEDSDQALPAVYDFYGSKSGVLPREFRDKLYVRRGKEAVKHVFRLASSLDSMVVGEPQITKQLKEALEIGRGAGTVKALLDRLITTALAVSKRVRNETGISRRAVSIPFAAVELARQIFETMEGLSIAILGTGEMGQVTVRNFLKHGASGLTGISRSQERAEAFVAPFGGRGVAMDQLGHVLSEVDVLIACTASNGYVIDGRVLRPALRKRQGRPLFLIDIAVPRNVSPEANDLENVYVYDIDDLSSVVESNKEERLRDAERAQRIIDMETECFMSWYRSLQVKPVVASIHRHAEQFVEEEFQKALRKLPDLDEKGQRVVRAAINGAVRKVLHQPTTSLKQRVSLEPSGELVSLAADLFGVEDAVGEPPVEATVDSEVTSVGKVPHATTTGDHA